MAAIITDDFRRNSVRFLVNDIIDKHAATASGITTDDDATKDSAQEFEYFIGIGKSDSWDNDSAGNNENAVNFSAPIPTGSVDETDEVLDNLIGAVALGNTDSAAIYHLIPRNNWTSGRRYKRWNKNDPDMFNLSTVGGITYYPCYTITSDKIYVCLDNGSSITGGFTPSTNTYVPQPSTTAPSGSNADAAGREPVQYASEGYVWAYVADLDTTSKFNTDQFVSISETATQRNGGSGTNGADDADAATGGIIYGFEILDAGVSTNTSSTGTTGGLEIVGIGGEDVGPDIDASGTTAHDALQLTYETDSSGRVSLVKFTAGTTPSSFPHDFERASVRIKAGQEATFTTVPKIRPLVAPKNGFGNKPTQDLPAFYAGIAVDLVGNLKSEVSTGLAYRQISLLRNLTRDTSSGSTSASDPSSGEGTYAANEVYDGLHRITCSSGVTSAITAGDIIKDVSDEVNAAGEPIPALAFVDYVDTSNNYIYYHQNLSTKINQQEFTAQSGSTNQKIHIYQNDGTTDRISSDLTYTAIHTPEATPRVGEVLFIENRKPIQRAAAQTEEIKLVIQF